jgi:hypothetical protein
MRSKPVDLGETRGLEALKELLPPNWDIWVRTGTHAGTYRARKKGLEAAITFESKYAQTVVVEVLLYERSRLKGRSRRGPGREHG